MPRLSRKTYQRSGSSISPFSAAVRMRVEGERRERLRRHAQRARHAVEIPGEPLGRDVKPGGRAAGGGDEDRAGDVQEPGARADVAVEAGEAFVEEARVVEGEADIPLARDPEEAGAGANLGGEGGRILHQQDGLAADRAQHLGTGCCELPGEESGERLEAVRAAGEERGEQHDAVDIGRERKAEGGRHLLDVGG